MGRHYGYIIIGEVLQLKAQGKTLREIGQKLGYSREQIKELLRREREKERKLAMGTAIKKKGRSSKSLVVTEKDRVADLRYKLNRKEYRIKQLERENELLRDFLKETGRR